MSIYDGRAPHASAGALADLWHLLASIGDDTCMHVHTYATYYASNIACAHLLSSEGIRYPPSSPAARPMPPWLSVMATARGGKVLLVTTVMWACTEYRHMAHAWRSKYYKNIHTCNMCPWSTRRGEQKVDPRCRLLYGSRKSGGPLP